MGRAGLVRGWRGLGVNNFATLLGEVGHRDHQNPKGEQYSESEWCSDQQAFGRRMAEMGQNRSLR